MLVYRMTWEVDLGETADGEYSGLDLVAEGEIIIIIIVIGGIVVAVVGVRVLDWRSIGDWGRRASGGGVGEDSAGRGQGNAARGCGGYLNGLGSAENL